VPFKREFFPILKSQNESRDLIKNYLYLLRGDLRQKHTKIWYQLLIFSESIFFLFTVFSFVFVMFQKYFVVTCVVLCF
jgi:hypothetical protein